MINFPYFTPDRHFLMVTFEVVLEQLFTAPDGPHTMQAVPKIISIFWHGMNVLPLLSQGYCQLFDDIEARAFEVMSDTAII